MPIIAIIARYSDLLVLLDRGKVACSGPTDAPDCIQLIFQPHDTVRHRVQETP